MFDDNHIEESDLLIRSILGDAQEEVPAHIWEGVAGGLDRVARRKTVVLWLGRTVAVAAAAAVAIGVFFRHGQEDVIVPEASGDMIAVVENIPAEDNVSKTEDLLLANVEKSIVVRPDTFELKAASEMTTTEDPEVEEVQIQENQNTAIEEETEITPVGTESLKEESISDNIASDDVEWKEEKQRKFRTSLVLSGIAGTNNPQNAGRLGPFRSPGIYKAPEKTTVERKNSQTTYGIPLSFGAGVKLNFNERWSLGMGLNYSLLTSRFLGKYTKVEGGTASLPIEATIRNCLHYIGIPINVYYNIINHDFINFYAYAGGAVEKCVANKYEIQTTPMAYHEETVKGVQLSANAGIGVEFMIGKYVGLYIDPSLRYYFSCNQPKSIRTAQPLMLGFEMGFRFNL